MDQLRGHSITYRIAVGPQQGRKVFTLQTLPDERDGYEAPATGNVAGFSLHAGVAAKANQRDKLERHVPLHHPSSGLRKASVPDETGQGSV